MLWEQQENLKKYGLSELDIPDRARKSLKKDSKKEEERKQKPTTKKTTTVADEYHFDPNQGTQTLADQSGDAGAKIAKVIRNIVLIWFGIVFISTFLELFFQDSVSEPSHQQESAPSEVVQGQYLLDYDDLGGDTFFLEQPFHQSENGLVLYQEAVTIYPDGQHQIHLLLENTTDVNMSVILNYLTANDYFIPGAVLYADVPVGESVQTQIWVDGEDLAQANISEIYRMSYSLNVMDADTQSYPTLFHTTPTPSMWSDTLVQSHDPSGLSLINLDGLEVKLVSVHHDPDYDSLNFLFYLENNSGQPVYFGENGIEILGYPFFSGIYQAVPENTVGFIPMDLPLAAMRKDLGLEEGIGYVDHMIFFPKIHIGSQLHQPEPLYIPVTLDIA